MIVQISRINRNYCDVCRLSFALLLHSTVIKVKVSSHLHRYPSGNSGICNALPSEPVSPVVEFCNVLQRFLGQNAKYAKSQKGAIFFLAQKAKAKTAKRSDGRDLGKKKAKMANCACNGHHKSTVKYGLMCYATCEV